MTLLVFAIFDAGNARCALLTPRRALRKAQDRYDKAAATAEVRAESKTPGVRERANAALTVALDALDGCRAAYEAAEENCAVLDQVERDAYARGRELHAQREALSAHV